MTRSRSTATEPAAGRAVRDLESGRPDPTAARGYTPAELARLLRVSPDRVRAWIVSGELGAVDTARVRCGRPRYVILPHHLAEWERRRRVGPPPQPGRRRKRT